MRAGMSAGGRFLWDEPWALGPLLVGEQSPLGLSPPLPPSSPSRADQAFTPQQRSDLRAGLQMRSGPLLRCLITQENGKPPTQLPGRCALLSEVLRHLPDIGFCRRTGNEPLPLKPEGLATFRDSVLVFRLWPGIGMNPSGQGFPRIRHPPTLGLGGTVAVSSSPRGRKAASCPAVLSQASCPTVSWVEELQPSV